MQGTSKKVTGRVSKGGSIGKTNKQIADNIRNKAGKEVFHVQFYKRTTNELRDMNCQLGVSRGVKGVGLQFKPAELGLMVVFDVDKDDYRMISLMDITHVVIDGVKYYGPRSK